MAVANLAIRSTGRQTASPDSVARDVATGVVTRDCAKALYGVALHDDGTADIDATEIQRANDWANRSPATSIDPALADLDGSVLNCPNCGTQTSFEHTTFAPSLVALEPLAAAGPLVAMRWQGNSPRFRLASIYCPGCGHRCETSQLRVGD